MIFLRLQAAWEALGDPVAQPIVGCSLKQKY